MIMSDCKICVLFLSKKKKKKKKTSGADEGPVLSTEVRLVLIIYAPHFKKFGGAYCVCIVRYFVRVFLRGLKHFSDG